jgi:hypothetical protein
VTEERHTAISDHQFGRDSVTAHKPRGHDSALKAEYPLPVKRGANGNRFADSSLIVPRSGSAILNGDILAVGVDSAEAKESPHKIVSEQLEEHLENRGNPAAFHRSVPSIGHGEAGTQQLADKVRDAGPHALRG